MVEVAVVLDDVDRPLEVEWEYCEIATRATMTMRMSAVADWRANRAAVAHVRWNLNSSVAAMEAVVELNSHLDAVENHLSPVTDDADYSAL